MKMAVKYAACLGGGFRTRKNGRESLVLQRELRRPRAPGASRQRACLSNQAPKGCGDRWNTRQGKVSASKGNQPELTASYWKKRATTRPSFIGEARSTCENNAEPWRTYESKKVIPAWERETTSPTHNEKTSTIAPWRGSTTIGKGATVGLRN